MPHSTNNKPPSAGLFWPVLLVVLGTLLLVNLLSVPAPPIPAQAQDDKYPDEGDSTPYPDGFPETRTAEIATLTARAWTKTPTDDGAADPSDTPEPTDTRTPSPTSSRTPRPTETEEEEEDDSGSSGSGGGSVPRRAQNDEPTDTPTETSTARPSRTRAPRDTPTDTPTLEETPTETLTPTVTPEENFRECPAGQVTLVEGNTRPNTALLASISIFDPVAEKHIQRVIGGDTSDAEGFYSIPLDITVDLSGNHLIQVKTRDDGRIVRELICEVLEPTPRLQP